MVVFNKRLVSSKQKIVLLYLKEIQGISNFGVKHICATLGINPYATWDVVTLGVTFCSRWNNYMESLPRYVGLYNVGLSPRFSMDIVIYSLFCINLTIKNSSLRGFLHKTGLPVRGQRTHTNRYTQRFLSKLRWVKIVGMVIKWKPY